MGRGSTAVAVVAADSADNSCSEAAAVAGRSKIAEDEAEVVVADVCQQLLQSCCALGMHEFLIEVFVADVSQQLLQCCCALGMHELLIEVVVVHIVQVILQRRLLGNLHQNLKIIFT